MSRYHHAVPDIPGSDRHLWVIGEATHSLAFRALLMLI
jgi:hypothetical protein